VLYVVAFPATVLVLVAIAVVTGEGKAAITVNSGGHAFTQILFAYASAASNNGLTMASLNANSVFYNLTTAIAMIVGRFVLAGLALAIAAQFAAQGRRPETYATLKTASLTFGGMLVAVIAVVGGLSYFVALALGPIAEHLSGGA
jgi:K+-transporting ATPase ATPase A chain